MGACLWFDQPLNCSTAMRRHAAAARFDPFTAAMRRARVLGAGTLAQQPQGRPLLDILGVICVAPTFFLGPDVVSFLSRRRILSDLILFSDPTLSSLFPPPPFLLFFSSLASSRCSCLSLLLL